MQRNVAFTTGLLAHGKHSLNYFDRCFIALSNVEKEIAVEADVLLLLQLRPHENTFDKDPE